MYVPDPCELLCSIGLSKLLRKGDFSQESFFRDFGLGSPPIKVNLKQIF